MHVMTRHTFLMYSCGSSRQSSSSSSLKHISGSTHLVSKLLVCCFMCFQVADRVKACDRYCRAKFSTLGESHSPYRPHQGLLRVWRLSKLSCSSEKMTDCQSDLDSTWYAVCRLQADLTVCQCLSPAHFQLHSREGHRLVCCILHLVSVG